MSGQSQAIKALQYAQHIQGSLMPALKSAEQHVAAVEYERAEYADLAGRLRVLEGAGGNRQETLTELGAGVWVEAVMPDTSRVLLDLGFDIHLELPVVSAATYAENRATMLQKRRDVGVKKVENIQWQIEQFKGAMNEVSTAPAIQG